MCQPKAKERPETGVGLMATYRQIREWVSRNHGFTAKNCWIAHCLEVVEERGDAWSVRPTEPVREARP